MLVTITLSWGRELGLGGAWHAFFASKREQTPEAKFVGVGHKIRVHCNSLKEGLNYIFDPSLRNFHITSSYITLFI